MRSSKNRSRSKGNRNRSVGNIVNRVFDSSGPEGKVRGTPQQIIDKYNQLAENFQQHAEHYTRMLSEAQREMEARREQQEQQQNQRRERQQEQRADAEQAQQPRDGGQAENAPRGGFDDVIDGGEGKSGLVETPEDGAKPRRNRRRRASAPDEGGETDGARGAEASQDQAGSSETAAE